MARTFKNSQQVKAITHPEQGHEPAIPNGTVVDERQQPDNQDLPAAAGCWSGIWRRLKRLFRRSKKPRKHSSGTIEERETEGAANTPAEREGAKQNYPLVVFGDDDDPWNIFDFLGFDEEDFVDEATVQEEQGLAGQENDTLPEEDTLEDNDDEDLTSEGSASSVVFPDWFEDDKLPGEDKKEEQATATGSSAEGESWHHAAACWHERTKERMDGAGDCGVLDEAAVLCVDEPEHYVAEMQEEVTPAPPKGCATGRGRKEGGAGEPRKRCNRQVERTRAGLPRLGRSKLLQPSAPPASPSLSGPACVALARHEAALRERRRAATFRRRRSELKGKTCTAHRPGEIFTSHLPVYGERFLYFPVLLTQQQRRVARVRSEFARRERAHRLRLQHVQKEERLPSEGQVTRFQQTFTSEKKVKISLPSPADTAPRHHHSLTHASPPPYGPRWTGLAVVPIGRPGAPPGTERAVADSLAALWGVLVPRQHGAAVLWRKEGNLSYLQHSLSYIRFFAFAERRRAARRRHGGAAAALPEALLRGGEEEGFRDGIASLVCGAWQLLPYVGVALGLGLHLPE